MQCLLAFKFMLERNSWELSLFSMLWLIGVSEISCKCPWQLCKQNLLLQPKSFELLSTAGGRQNTFCCHCLQHKLTMTHHPLHSSLGCRAGFIINSQGFLYALFQTIDKRSMLKFGEMKKKKWQQHHRLNPELVWISRAQLIPVMLYQSVPAEAVL